MPLQRKEITVNHGQRHQLTFQLYLEMPGSMAPYYRQIDIGDRSVWIKDDINIFQIAIGGTFDSSIPDSLWKELFFLGGEGAARGVYCYDTSFGDQYAHGKFMHYTEALRLATKKIAQAYKEASSGQGA